MVERIYDTIKAILYTDFPKDSQGYPQIYDRVIQEWFFGDREILPSPLGVILRNTSSTATDIGYGLREIEYNIGITFYSSNDDKDTSERVIQEAARVAHSILKNHRSMYVCDLCPFCGKLPLSPIHYIDNGVITSVGINTATLPVGVSSYTVTVAGTAAGQTGTAYIKLVPGISGAVTSANILSSGLGIQATTYSDSYADLTFTLSGGSGHTGFSTTVMESYVTTVLNNIDGYWQETHSTSSPAYYDWAGVAYQAVEMLVSDWAAGIQEGAITGNPKWGTNLNAVVNNNVQLVRYLQDIRVGDIKPSDDGMNKAFLHSAEFTMKAKEIISVDQFGPNNVNVNAV